jgi:hypothetical protein
MLLPARLGPPGLVPKRARRPPIRRRRAAPRAPLASSSAAAPLPPLGVAPAASALGAAPHASAVAPEKPPAKTDAPVRLGDTKVFVFRVAAGDKSPTVRARAATEALATALDDPNLEVRVVRQGDAAIIYAGPTPVAQLFQEDALAAGDGSLDLHASVVASKVRRAISSERGAQEHRQQRLFVLAGRLLRADRPVPDAQGR